MSKGSVPKGDPRDSSTRVSSWWKNLLPHYKWMFIGFVVALPGIVLTRLSNNPGFELDDVGKFGLLLAGIGFLILLFVALPVSILDWRRGKTGFWHD
jgi:hypothetical protein